MSSPNDWVYTEKVKEHFMQPKNILMDEENYKADGKGVVGNIKCGDQMMMAIKVDQAKGIIADCKWKTYGCASAIASTSVLSEMVKGMTLEQAYHLSPKDVAKELGNLPEHKIHCSVLGDKALRAAINDYYVWHGMADKVQKEAARIVCQCMNITDHEIEDAVLEGARTFYELQERTKIGTVCGQCKDEATHMVETFIKKHFEK
ncbi:MAG: iron-sulfur cluster assembly scaffold protein [Omnitrophica bacterium RIFCSPLOWO2_12_FULL_44_17]|uniref:Iron-sulfur cluster assembly scaffold protein n=1 Tax=Candidatus Danuiimicrobium aquiferis TaxID=1801832 RepID=A0A1G1L315_9BACT|nr:MAG: iron-sulfur cluster assembly scaffold protein [Omnitrophica bacterium RIFCSPHIGHO2_02_FULL_45_28]OGW92437.1 MAG: iron-sulfur cluster assembly scaffold protein [Omnitrophica bacterium RIFCSPHIGHO2_12_FULL_44_12]OGW99526.1 MAG: iron-sulfur cluster assembly scaffold protein [Omnitrophica bacterium RIFCSPLOWO2_12_FULL_44_17]OGX02698.1 MAG: iron-sulfur cluster assembly scaffold protein [Omnitrophica bacterium RIFCSPLOWO2_02_FULL_44_11]